MVASAFYTVEKFSITLRGTEYGTSSENVSPNGANFYNQRVGPAFIADTELNFRATDHITFSIGANNFFDKRPPRFQCVLTATTATACKSVGTNQPTVVTGGNVYDAPLGFSPYGINGGFYYGRFNLKF